jgi:hypothetical protein
MWQWLHQRFDEPYYGRDEPGHPEGTGCQFGVAQRAERRRSGAVRGDLQVDCPKRADNPGTCDGESRRYLQQSIQQRGRACGRQKSVRRSRRRFAEPRRG